MTCKACYQGVHDYDMALHDPALHDMTMTWPCMTLVSLHSQHEGGPWRAWTCTGPVLAILLTSQPALLRAKWLYRVLSATVLSPKSSVQCLNATQLVHARALSLDWCREFIHCLCNVPLLFVPERCLSCFMLGCWSRGHGLV